LNPAKFLILVTHEWIAIAWTFFDFNLRTRLEENNFSFCQMFSIQNVFKALQSRIATYFSARKNFFLWMFLLRSLSANYYYYYLNFIFEKTLQNAIGKFENLETNRSKLFQSIF
jgi:S-adenosylmethionine:diacylglycerol 3-amino-3-carboxypropyl transferase